MSKYGHFMRVFDTTLNNYEDKSAPLLINMIGYAVANPPFELKGQRNDYYVQYMQTGILSMTLPGGETQTFTEGQFIIHEPHVDYEYRSADDDTEIAFYSIHFTGSYAEKLLSDLGLECGKIYDYGCDNYDLKNVFDKMISEFQKRTIGFLEESSALLTRALVKMARVGLQVHDEIIPNLRFMRSFRYITVNYKKDIQISHLAQMEHLSVNRYRDVFKEYTGMTPKEYIIKLRLDRACELFSKYGFAVTLVASECGYTDVLYFIRLFKRKIGITPGEYRQLYAPKRTAEVIDD